MRRVHAKGEAAKIFRLSEGRPPSIYGKRMDLNLIETGHSTRRRTGRSVIEIPGNQDETSVCHACV